jgi:hypothetical protein
MGNSDAEPIEYVSSVASSAPLWSHIMREVSKGLPIEKFKRPDGLVEVEVDAFSGMRPGPGTVRTVTELFIDGTQQQLRRDDMHVEEQIDRATGLLWQDSCTGPKVSRYFLDFSQVESRFPEWQKFTQGWAKRAARGPGVRGGPDRTPTAYFFDGSLVPFGRTWGGRFAPTEVCSAKPPICEPGGGPPTPEPSIIIPCVTPEPEPTPTATKGNGNGKTPPPTTNPSVIDPTPAGVVPLGAFPLFIPLVALIIGRLLRPNRRN